MTFDPLLNASPIIQGHTAMAFIAISLTVAIFTVRRGSSLHKGLGRAWVIAMGLATLSSFWIFDLKIWGNYSPIHLLSVFTLVQLVLAVRAARRGDIQLHRNIMKGLVFGALVGAGAFTLLPGRTMYQVFLGG